MIEAKSSRKSNFCAAHNYPYLKNEGWYLVVANGQSIVFFEHFNFDQEFKEFKVECRQDKPGTYSLSIYLYSDCYYGLDIESSVKYEVKPPRKFEEEEHHH